MNIDKRLATLRTHLYTRLCEFQCPYANVVNQECMNECASLLEWLCSKYNDELWNECCDGGDTFNDAMNVRVKRINQCTQIMGFGDVMPDGVEKVELNADKLSTLNMMLDLIETAEQHCEPQSFATTKDATMQLLRYIQQNSTKIFSPSVTLPCTHMIHKSKVVFKRRDITKEVEELDARVASLTERLGDRNCSQMSVPCAQHVDTRMKLLEALCTNVCRFIEVHKSEFLTWCHQEAPTTCGIGETARSMTEPYLRVQQLMSSISSLRQDMEWLEESDEISSALAVLGSPTVISEHGIQELEDAIVILQKAVERRGVDHATCVLKPLQIISMSS